MVRPKRAGLTLVEVVVVVAVLALVLMLVVAYLGKSNRSPGRRSTCMNNQKQISLALMAYEQSQGRFPGYVNRLPVAAGANPVVCSWVVPLFPFLDRSDLYGKWKEGDKRAVYLWLMVCPSDPPASTAPGATPLSYVVNCGLPGDADTQADGVFFNHDVDGAPVTTSLSYLAAHDGAALTLMLSENIQAGNWTDTDEADLGMVWRPEPEECSAINACKDAGDRPQDIRYARPSSNHPGGVVVSFCDGHQEVLREDIDYRVYQHLMTPDSAKAGVPGKLQEGDF